ncbi:DNA-binding response regulator [Enterobacter cloacae]|nr:DNA-binding response regulator [Enterobacter cloacae]
MANFLVIDDHPLVRLAIRFLLEKNGHSVSLESDDASEIISSLKSNNVDGIIIDIDLPGEDGIEAIRKIRTIGIKTPTIVLSAKQSDYYINESMKVGANGFISKKNNLGDLSLAVNAVFSGYGYFPYRIRDLYNNANTDHELIKKLSDREYEVLIHLAEGKELSAIAIRMGLNYKTISTYKSRLMEKLLLKNTKEFLDFVKRNNLG